VVALTSLIFIFASLLRLGNLAVFVSRPVLRGFAFGLAITIMLKQIPELVGYKISAPDIPRLAAGILHGIPEWHVPSVVIGIAAFSALMMFRRFPALPGSFIVLAVGILASWAFSLKNHGVAVVGSIDFTPHWPEITSVKWSEIREVFPYTLSLALILFAESWGTIRSLSLRHGESPSANREVGAIGVANLVSAVIQGMPVGAGFSAGQASEAAGAETRATAVIAAIVLAFLVFFFMSEIAILPKPVLAAVVIAALSHAVDPSPLFRLWHLKRDWVVAVAAAIGVISLGVIDGVVLAIVLSMAALLHKLAYPQVAQLGRFGSGHDFVDIARHHDAAAVEGVGIWRPSQQLFFANADPVLGVIRKDIESDPSLRAVVISLEESIDLDSTALEALVEFDGVVRVRGLRLQYARVHDRVRDLFVSSGSTLSGYCSYSVDDAVSAAVGETAATNDLHTITR
jgi:MFS superfamily sulfate permease-like transporter